MFILIKIFAKPGKCNSNSFVFSYDDVCGSCLHLENVIKMSIEIFQYISSTDTDDKVEQDLCDNNKV